MIRVLLLLLLSVTLSCQSSNSELRIAAASSMKYALEELSDEFEKLYSFRPQIVLGSSGKLFAQISKGAPYHLFISADSYYPATLKNELNLKVDSEVYAYGRLVLCIDSSKTINDLQQSAFTKIAISNPDIAPYGKAAKEALKNSGLWETVESKLVFGESVGQTNQFIHTGACDAGFTSYSSVIQKHLDVSYVLIDQNLHAPIAQSLLVLDGPAREQAKAFRDFIFSERGRSVLAKYGYFQDNE